MTQSEQLNIILRTIAETSGATQTQTALRQVNASAEQANAGLRRTGQVAREAGSSFRIGAEDVLRFGTALTGVELGISIFTSAGRQIHNTIAQSIQDQADAQRTVRATAAAYGAQADQFTRFAAALSTQTGFTRTAILEAALSARTLSTNYGLTIQQTQRLIQVSADLAQVRGIGVAEAFERVQSAIRGEAEASEFLGLTLNATFLQQNAANGAYRQTFTTLTDAQRAQVVYNEVLRQTAAFQGLAASSAQGLDGSMTRAATAANNLRVALGEMTQPTVIDALQAEARIASDLEFALRRAGELRKNDFARNVADTAISGVPIVGTARDLAVLTSEALHKLAEPQREAALQARNAALQTQDILTAQQDVASQLQSSVRHAQQFTRTLNQAQREAATLKNELAAIDKTVSDISDFRQNISSTSGLQPQLAAAASAQQIERQVRTARQAAEFLQEQQRLLEQTSIGTLSGIFGGPANVLGEAQRQAQQRLAITQQLMPLEEALASAQRIQGEVQAQIAQGAAAEATAILQVLPQRQEIARVEREIADAVDKQTQLRQTQVRLLAQQAAQGPQNILDDTRSAIERDRLVLANRRGTSPEERIAARREIRDLSRNVLPGQELSAFDANRNVALAERTERSTALQTAIQQIPLELRRLSLVDAIRPLEDGLTAIQQQNEIVSQLGRVAEAAVAARQQTLDVTVRVIGDDLSSGGFDPNNAQRIADLVGQEVTKNVFGQLKEGLGQAQFPALIPQSGVRHQ